MNARFRQILSLALRPETPEGEASAAFAAARRMAAKEGVDSLLTTDSVVKEKERIVYRDVYRDRPHKNPYAQHKMSGELKATATSLHGILQVAFKYALDHNVVIVIQSATTTNKQISGETILQIDLYGDSKNVQAWFADIRSVIELNKKNKSSNPNNNELNSSKKEPGFWSKLFGAK